MEIEYIILKSRSIALIDDPIYIQKWEIASDQKIQVQASVKTSDKHEGISIETISLQDTLLAEAMYSCDGKSEKLQEVLRTDLTFQDEEFIDLPFHIKFGEQLYMDQDLQQQGLLGKERSLKTTE